MLLARKTDLCQRPSLVWRLSSLLAAGAVIVLAVATAGIQPAAGQADEAAPAAQDANEAPPDAPAGETKAEDEANVRETQAPSEAAAGEQSKRSTAAEMLLREQVRQRVAQARDLEEKLAVAQSELAALKARIHDLEANGEKFRVFARFGDAAVKRAAVAAVEMQRLLDLARINEDGSISSEIWSTDAEGQPKELLGRRLDKSPDESPWTVSTITGGDEIVKVFTADDGTSVTYVFDAGTGRVISRKFSRGRDVPPPKAPAARASLKVGEKLSVSALRNEELRMKSRARKNADHKAESEAAETSAAGAHAGRSPAELDLVGLVTAYADALTDTDEAKAALSEVPESRAARSALRSAQRKQHFLKMFVEEAANNAKSKLEYARKMASRGYLTADAVANAGFRLRILTDILNADSDTAGDVPAAR